MNPKFITIHCSATNPAYIYTFQQLKKDHLARGFNDVGYHFYINQSGALHRGRDINRQGAHVQGHNKDNIGICLEGGINHQGKAQDNFTDAQMAQLRFLLTELQSVYGVKDKDVKGHRDWYGDTNGDGVIDSRDWLKECPCFDIKDKRKEWA